MSLNPGTKLGPYEILAPLGAGGMGEVYKAKDTRLERTVAIKVLPSHVASHPEVRQRFEREARAVSSLNHPHICTLHDIGSENGIDFMVMEHIEGDTLADRLKKGALPLDQALQYGIEIADALDKAHRQGVVHRDLKPGNIMLTKSGAKLLDFGLAKMSVAETDGASLSALPTEAQPLTKEGSILGTFQYMAPEQLEGKEADARTDIFAFGAVLYEMATGRKAFAGTSQASLIGAIMSSHPQPISALHPPSPRTLDHTVMTCLAKDPNERWQNAGDLRRGLEWIAEGSQDTSDGSLVATRTSRERTWGVTGLVIGVIVAGIGVWGLTRPEPPTRAPLQRFSLNLPSDAQYLWPTNFAMSPDGARLVYVAAVDGGRQLYSRALDQLDAQPMAGTADALRPFFSPDGEWVGFFTPEGKLKKVSVGGGPPLTLCDAPFPGGGSWGMDDVIIFASRAADSDPKLFRIPATGGSPEVLPMRDKLPSDFGLLMVPEILPGGKAILVAAVNNVIGNASTVAVSLETGEYRIVAEPGILARYAPSGHVVYIQESTLMAVPFDLERLETTGPPGPVLEGVLTDPFEGTSAVAFSQNGILTYVSGTAEGGDSRLVLVDRHGVARPVTETPAVFSGPRMSPDGRSLAVTVFDDSVGQRDIWISQLSRGTLSRLTFADVDSTDPVWTPDGEQIIFSSPRSGGTFGMFSKPAHGGAPAVRLATNGSDFACNVSADGKLLLFRRDQFSNEQIGVLSLENGGDAKILLETSFRHRHPALSPDGRWLAYSSGESGRREVYVRSFPSLRGKWQISTDGGAEPLWSGDGRELFYRNRDKMMVVAISTEPEFAAGLPAQLFEGRYGIDPFGFDAHNYDVSPDGQTFLMVEPIEGGSTHTRINVVINWFEELKELVPTN